MEVGREHAAPDRDTGDGPYPRLILRRARLIDGTGAPPFGPVDVVVEGDRIAAIWVHPPLGGPQLQPATPPEAGPGGREIDLDGHYVLPGFVDAHAHVGWPGHVPGVQYTYDLWLAHGVTTAREPGCFINGLDFVVGEARRSAANEIAAPRMLAYAGFGLGRTEGFETADEVRDWVRGVAAAGADGLKLWGYREDLFRAAIEEADGLGLGTMCHHQQRYVSRATALDSARWGLGSIEHWYGIPEAMLDGRRLQAYPLDYDYQDEWKRFDAAGRLWAQAAPRGSARWDDTVAAFVETGVTLDPTFSVYAGLRDASRIQRLPWHDEYTAPVLWDYWQPHSGAHGSFLTGWGTEQEVAWRQNMRRWMDFVADFHRAGGRVTVGTDPGSIFTLFGFAFPHELEMLREAGLEPLEILHAATLAGAESLGMADRIGSIEVGKLADIVVVRENPLQDLKRLYAPFAGGPGGGPVLTIKDGIVYDPAVLLKRVRDTVREGRRTGPS